MSFVWGPLLPGGAQLQSAAGEVTGAGVGTRTVTGSAAGVHGVVATAAGTEAATGDADALHGVAAMAAGAESATGASSGVHGVTATASGSEAVIGAAEGNHPAPVEGTATASRSVVAASAGAHGVAGAAAGAESAVGVASGSFGEVEPVAVSGGWIRRKRRHPARVVVGAAAARVTVRGSGIGSVQRPSSTGRASSALRPAAQAVGVAFSRAGSGASEEQDLADLEQIARLRGDRRLAMLVEVLRDDLAVRRRRAA